MKTEKKLIDNLHKEVTQQLLLRVRSGEATASELSVAVKFLKDNGASLDVIMDQSPMASLLKDLPFDVGEKLQ